MCDNNKTIFNNSEVDVISPAVRAHQEVTHVIYSACKILDNLFFYVHVIWEVY